MKPRKGNCLLSSGSRVRVSPGTPQLTAYRTYARAEGKSEKTVRWITQSVGYFADFLGPGRQDLTTIGGNDLRRFIITLQSKHKFSDHPYNKPLKTNLLLRTYGR
ncbi:MAG: hypothetical protein HYX90_10270 [Chloroflexi bacterium]|nr:hypothetical protein [Chloroflexota bacterium]